MVPMLTSEGVCSTYITVAAAKRSRNDESVSNWAKSLQSLSKKISEKYFFIYDMLRHFLLQK